MQARTIYLIKRVETEVTSNMIRLLGTYDITPAQFTILSFVGDNKSDFSSAQLSRRFSMTPPSMNEMVTILQRKGLLGKISDPNHKRILRLRLTEQGQKTLDLCNLEMDNFEKVVFDSLGEKDLAEYRRLMGIVLNKTKSLLPTKAMA